MADSSSIIDPGLGTGYDYDSLLDWEAQNLNLTTQAGIETAYCRSTNGAADTETCSIAGWTLSATYYVDIQNDDSGGYDYLVDVDGAHCISVGQTDFYGWIRGLTVEVSSSVDTKGGINCGSSFDAGWIKIEKCLIRMGSSTAGYICGIFGVFNTGGGATIYARNCIIHDFSGTNNVAVNIRAGFTAYIYNCTACDSNYGFWNNSATAMTCKNCLAYNNSDGFRGSPTTSYCATSQAEGLSGTGDRNSQTFTFVDAGANNFHLQSTDTGALGYGLNLYNDATWPFQDDFDSNGRGGSGAPWDIGADEYALSASYSASKQDLTLSVLQASVSISTAGINVAAAKQDLFLSINSIQIHNDAFYADTKRDIVLSINVSLYASGCMVGVIKQDLSLNIQSSIIKLSPIVAGTKQDISISILQATVLTTSSVQVVAAKQDLTLLVLQAAASIIAQVVVGKQDLILSVLSPIVRLDTVEIDSVRNLTLSINAVTVSTVAGINIQVAKQDLIFSILSPTIKLNTVDVDSVRNLVLSVNSTTVSTVAGVNVQVDKQNLTLTVLSATITAQEQGSYFASCQNIFLSILSSLQIIDHFESINKQDLSIVLNSPEININAFYAAAQQALSFSQIPIEFFITHNIGVSKQDLYFSIYQTSISVAQVQGQLTIFVNEYNMQPKIVITGHQPQIVAN